MRNMIGYPFNVLNSQESLIGTKIKGIVPISDCYGDYVFIFNESLDVLPLMSMYDEEKEYEHIFIGGDKYFDTSSNENLMRFLTEKPERLKAILDHGVITQRHYEQIMEYWQHKRHQELVSKAKEAIKQDKEQHYDQA